MAENNNELKYCNYFPDVKFDDFTTGKKGDNGYLDKVISVVTAHLQEMCDKGYITTDKFAELYLALIPEAMKTALQFTLQEHISNAQAEQYNAQACKLQKEKCLTELEILLASLKGNIDFGGTITNEGTDEECDWQFKNDPDRLGTAEYEREKVKQQGLLYERQRLGIDQDAKQKFINALLQAWQVRFSSDPANASTTPQTITKCMLDKIIKRFGEEDENLIELIEALDFTPSTECD